MIYIKMSSLKRTINKVINYQRRSELGEQNQSPHMDVPRMQSTTMQLTLSDVTVDSMPAIQKFSGVRSLI